MGEGISNQGALGVIKGSIPGSSILADNGISYAFPGVAIIIRALYVDQAAAGRIMVGDINASTFRRDPLAVSLGRVDDLLGACIQVETRCCIRR